MVSVQDGQRLAEEFGANVGFVETSAKSDIRVEEVFQSIVRNIKANEKVTAEAEKKKSSRCVLV